ncbi:MAG TPA: hypothetical protein VNZ26_04820, partial [Vicinamibacterales bacterium]|nr:hypothetical protein [Vicinamibacterales bacterium]
MLLSRWTRLLGFRAETLNPLARCSIVVVIAWCALFLTNASGRTAQGALAALSLSEFFKPGVVFQDRNGDGVVDFVDARFVLPERPAPGELAAAADVAARLGFETSAMNLPLMSSSGTPSAPNDAIPIFIGSRSLVAAGTTAAALAGPLRAGDGVVTALNASGRFGVAVLGGDEDGLTAAAVMLAGHLPYVWDQKGPTTDKIAEDVRAYLGGKGVEVSSAAVPAVYVRHRNDGAERVVVDVQVANAADVIKAEVALNQLKISGLVDQKRPLSYPRLRALRVRMRAAGSGLVTI